MTRTNLHYDVGDYHIEAEAKWPPSCRWHFQNNVWECKCLYFNYNFTEICSQRHNWQQANICSDSGLALIRWQVISETMAVCFTDAFMRHPASKSDVVTVEKNNTTYLKWLTKFQKVVALDLDKRDRKHEKSSLDTQISAIFYLLYDTNSSRNLQIYNHLWYHNIAIDFFMTS